jgi:hypothetical protein
VELMTVVVEYLILIERDLIDLIDLLMFVVFGVNDN